MNSAHNKKDNTVGFHNLLLLFSKEKPTEETLLRTQSLQVQSTAAEDWRVFSIFLYNLFMHECVLVSLHAWSNGRRHSIVLIF